MTRLLLLTAQLTITLLWLTQLSLADPDWMSLKPVRSGNILTVTCQGTGPARDIALKLAHKQCTSIASDQLSGDFNVSSLSIETQGSTGFHQEVSANRKVENLDCQIVKQSIESRDGSFVAFLACSFDISKAKFVSYPVEPESQDRVIASEDKIVTISSIPICDDIAVVGKSSRILECKTNPSTVLLRPGDKELIVRTKGYLPKHLKTDSDSYQLVLERE